MLTVNEMSSQSSPISAASIKKKKLRLPAYVTREWAAKRHSVNELQSCLSEAGVPLALKREKRDYYQGLFDTLLRPLIEGDVRRESGRGWEPYNANYSVEKDASDPDDESGDDSDEDSESDSVGDELVEEVHHEVEEVHDEVEDEIPREYEWDTLQPSTPSPVLPPKTPVAMSRLSSSSFTPIKQSPSASAQTFGTPMTARKPFKFTRTGPQPVLPSKQKQKNDLHSPGYYALSVAAALIFVLVSTQAAVYYSLWNVAEYRRIGTPRPEFILTGVNALDTILTNIVAPGISRECPKGAACAGKRVIACVQPDFAVRYDFAGNWIAKWIGSEQLLYALPFVATPRCVYDGAKIKMEVKKQVQVENLILQLNDIVRIWIGRMSCGEQNPDAEMTQQELSLARDRKSNRWIGLPISSAKRQLREFIGEKWTEDKFEEHWSLILNRIAAASASSSSGKSTTSNGTMPLYTIVEQSASLSGHRVLVSHDDPLLSTTCALKTSLWSFACIYYPYLFAAAVLLLSAAYISHRNAARIRDSHVTATLVEDILDTLHTTHELHLADRIACPIDGVSVAQLRSHFVRTLRDVDVSTGSTLGGGLKGARYSLDEYGYAAELDAHERTRWIVADSKMADALWAGVSSSVLRNACVMETVSEIAGGEDCVWQWIGGFALSPRTRKIVGSNANASVSESAKTRNSAGDGSVWKGKTVERGRALQRDLFLEDDDRSEGTVKIKTEKEALGGVSYPTL
ncbi:hypothetical protein HDU78_003761 [Chytriomyces hyalinus]|nr:hypothetical protein HDU78_003761 [Chytriomyces hyalinus]